MHGFSYGDITKNTQPDDLLNNSALTLFRVLLVVLVDGEKMLFIVILFLHLVFALHFSMNLNALYNVMLCSALKCMMKWRAKTKWIKLYISDLIFEPKRQSNNSVCVPNNFWDHVSKHCIEKFQNKKNTIFPDINQFYCMADEIAKSGIDRCLLLHNYFMARRMYSQ